jgi:DNA polymerase elongation subunit (family B)
MVSNKEIEEFLHGENSEEFIVSIEYDYRKDLIYKVREIPGVGKEINTDTFTPFCWVGDISDLNFYKKSKALQKEAMSKHGIVIEKLSTGGNERMENGLVHMVKSTKSYQDLRDFFIKGGINLNDKNIKQKMDGKLIMLPPVEQYLIAKQKRLFKGFSDYDEVTRFVFDIETTGLNPEKDRIFMIGMKTNKGFHKVLEAIDENLEEYIIVEFFDTINKVKPTIIGGYYSFNFDWDFIIKRAMLLGLDVTQICKTLNPNKSISRKESFIKLGGEVESYMQTKLWGYNVIDIIHAVRRAQAINSEIKESGLKYITKYIKAEDPDRVYIEHDKIGKMYQNKEQYWLNPKNGNYRKFEEYPDLGEKYPNRYLLLTGDKIVERYLDDDLEETLKVDKEFSQASFLLASMVPTTYEKIYTMGTAGVWRLLMLAWSYKNKIAIPEKAQKREFIGGLSRLLRVGYSRTVLKLDFASLYPSIQLTHDIFPECDTTGVLKSMLNYFRDTRIKYKELAAEWYDKDKKISESYNNKQQPIKIFINSMFGSLSAPYIFEWGDVDMGEMITCIGRQYLRQMIKFFISKGYTPLVCDTDGVNFSCPEGIENYEYVGKGLNWKVKEGKVYKGYDAHVAEYNDLYMRKQMALDTDGTWDSTINLSRKNYAVMTHSGKVKLTGNTIKSKKMPKYIEDFLDEALKMLLKGDGHGFVQYYYSYIEKIYEKQIPLIKIANKSKVKITPKEYKERSLQRTKAGSLMSKMAHMELLIKDNITANIGDVVYYVNNGTKKLQGDVETKKIPKYDKDEMKRIKLENNGKIPDSAYDRETVTNCYLLQSDFLEKNPDMTGDYNVARAIETFNTRISPLLVVFNETVRENLLIDNPEKKYFFTKTQCELINGIPLKEGQQDDLEADLLSMSDDEVLFWKRKNIEPDFMYVERGL